MTDYTESVTDVLTIVEARTQQTKKDTADAVSIAEVLTKKASLVLSDSFTTSEQLGRFTEAYTTLRQNNPSDAAEALKTKIETLESSNSLLYIDIVKDGSMYIGVVVYELN